MFDIQRIDHVAFKARDVEKLAAWYQTVLGMERVYADAWTGAGDPVALCAGTACVALFRYRDGESYEPDEWHGSAHFAMSLDAPNFKKAQEELSQRGIEFRLWDHKVSHSIYFPDPEGHQIELTTYDI